MNIVHDKASPLVTEILNNLSQANQNWFLAHGEAQAYSAAIIPKDGSFSDMKTVYYPMLSGFAVGQPQDKAEDAIALANERKAHFMNEEREPFDIAAAGIDEVSPLLRRAAFDANMRVDAIFHLGTMRDGSVVDELVELIEEADSSRRYLAREKKKVARKMASLADSPTLPGVDDGISDKDRRIANMPEMPICAQIPCLEKLLDDYDEDFDRENADELLQTLSEMGYEGFLIQATVPEMKPSPGGSVSIHYGMRHIGLFYGHTYKAAVDAALEWANEKTNAMRARKAA